VCALLLLRISDNWELAATLQMVAVGVGITACGSGAAKVRSRCFHARRLRAYRGSANRGASDMGIFHFCDVEQVGEVAG